MQTEKNYFDDYLSVLAAQYPDYQSTASEIINLEAILRLPKGTEHFLSDIHGEYDAFCHIMNNCSGVVREKIETLYGERMSERERDEFATLIYYPAQIISEMKTKRGDLKAWYMVQLHRLVEVCRTLASKYTRSKVRKSLPRHHDYIIDELINMDRADFNKEAYYDEIFQSIIELNRAESFILAITDVIKRLAVDKLHIVGDLYDRGGNPAKILDILTGCHDVDIQWGNHDVLWIGAHTGNEACMLTVVENSLKYDNLDVLEEDYGISLRKLAEYAQRTFGEDRRFYPDSSNGAESGTDKATVSKMRKAVFFMLLKAEGQTLERRTEYGMQSRSILKKIDYERGTVELNGETVKLNRNDFVTVNKADPLAYTAEESEIVNGLKRSFTHSEKLFRHIAFLMKKGTAFLVYNDNLIFHGCIPLNEDGSYREFEGKKGKALLQYADTLVRRAYNAFLKGEKDEKASDFLWYLWCGKSSPLFGREKMTTFERIYVDDPAYHSEQSNAYYRFCTERAFCERILRDFGIEGKYSHIINGHVPVKKKDGESPIKAEGKLIVIDGGFCKALHAKTGIAGYTLIYNSHGLKLCAHEPFDSVEKAIETRSDIHSEVTVFETREKRLLVRDTDIGKRIQKQIDGLKSLYERYKKSE